MSREHAELGPAPARPDVVPSLPVAVVTLDAAGRVTSWNPAAAALYGHAESAALGRPFAELTGADPREAETVRAFSRPDGSLVDVRERRAPLRDASGRTTGTVLVAEEATPREGRAVAAAQRKLLHAEKLATLGGVVSGVAHEVRTPLAYVQNNLMIARLRAERARAEGAPPGDLAPFFDAAEEGIRRINRIVEALRRFVRLETGRWVVEGLDDAVGEAVHLYRVTHAADISIELSPMPTPPVRLDRVAIQQIVLNLVQNAADASAPGRAVHVETGAADDGRALLRVRDEGAGMTPEVQRRMFDEFFTTKSSGAGLGLSIVRRLVEEHHGELRVRSAPGEGTDVTVLFPASADRMRGHQS